MNDTSVIDNCQSHLPVNIKLITGVMIDIKPHLSRTCKTSLLFAPLAVCVQAGCSTFPLDTPTKLLVQLYFKYKTVLISKLKIF